MWFRLFFLGRLPRFQMLFALPTERAVTQLLRASSL